MYGVVVTVERGLFARIGPEEMEGDGPYRMPSMPSLEVAAPGWYRLRQAGDPGPSAEGWACVLVAEDKRTLDCFLLGLDVGATSWRPTPSTAAAPSP